MVYLQPSLLLHLLLSFLVLTTEGVVQSEASSTTAKHSAIEEIPTQSENTGGVVDGARSYTKDPLTQEKSRTNDNSGETLWVNNVCRQVKTKPECSMCHCKTIGYKRLLIDCSGKGLCSVPKCIPPETTDLNLSNNNISEIYGDSFRKLTQLKLLDLNNISLITMHPSALHSLSKLIILDISRNPGFPMTNWTIDQGLFQNLTKLKVLSMYGNTHYLSNGTYPDAALSKLVALKELNIDGLQDKTFGPGFKSLRSLRTVHMSGFFVEQDLVVRYCSTNITQGMLDNLETIDTLIMRGCYIMSIHTNAFNNTRNLTHLDLSYNRALEMSGMKPAFKSLARTKLKVLKLNAIYNRMNDNLGVSLKADDVKGLQNLAVLRELHLEGNAIVNVHMEVPKEFPATLEILNVRNNKFEIGPYLLNVVLLENLRIIDVSYQSFPALLKENTQRLSTNSRLEERVYSSVNTSEYGDDIVTHSAVKSHTETSNDMSTLGHEDKWTTSLHEDVFQQKYGYEGHIKDDLFTPTIHNPNGISSDEEDPDDKSICHQPPQNLLQIITPNLPPNLRTIDLSFSRFELPIFRINVSGLNQLTTINLSQCMLYCWDGPVDGVEKLEYLNLRRNFCANVRRGFFDTFPNLKTLIISENLLNKNISGDKKGRYFRNLTKLEELDMSYNRLEVIPENILQHQTNLRRLDVSKNILSGFHLTISHMKQLQVVNVSYNTIFTLNEAFRENLKIVAQRTYKISEKPLEIDLRHNSLHCVCSTLGFLRWLRDGNGSYMIIHATKCMLKNETATDISNKGNIIKVIKTLEKQCASYFALAVLLTVLLLFVINVTLAIIVYRYRWRIRYWYYVTKRDIRSRRSGYKRLLDMNTSGEHALISGQYKYDAFIASTENDRMFVLDNLMPVLKERRLRLCVPDEDFVPGQNIYRMISNAIHSSRVSVFVVSSVSALDGEWEIAMRMVQQESLRRGRQSFFAIFLEEIPTSQMFSYRWIDIGNMYRDQQYITYPSQVQAEELGLFWDECTRRINEPP